MEIRHLKIAVVMMDRAPLKGAEAADVAEAMQAITALIREAEEAQKQPPALGPQGDLTETEEEDGDDARPDE